MISVLSAAAGAGSATQSIMTSGVIPIAGMLLVMWLLILRPQMKRQREQQTKIGAVKKGDQVLTGGGLMAKVVKVDENYAELEIAPNVRVKALKSTIVDVVPPGGVAPAND